MPVRKQDAHRALELLEDYHSRLVRPQDKPLKNAIERVIRIFKSRLFQALLDIQEFYECTLLDETKDNSQKTAETLQMVMKWEKEPPIITSTLKSEKQNAIIDEDLPPPPPELVQDDLDVPEKQPPTFSRPNNVGPREVPPPKVPVPVPSYEEDAQDQALPPPPQGSDDGDYMNGDGDWEYEEIPLERNGATAGVCTSSDTLTHTSSSSLLPQSPNASPVSPLASCSHLPGGFVSQSTSNVLPIISENVSKDEATPGDDVFTAPLTSTQSPSSHLFSPVRPFASCSYELQSSSQVSQLPCGGLSSQSASHCPVLPSTSESVSQNNSEFYCYPSVKGYQIPKKKDYKKEYRRNLMTEKRKDPQFKKKERACEVFLKKKKRSDKNFRETERLCERENKRQKRSDKNFRETERLCERENKRQKRSDKNFRETERLCERENKRQKRSDKNFRETERLCERENKRQKRSDKNFHETERLCERENKRQKRSDKNFRETERLCERENKRQKRSDKKFRETERLCERENKRQKRSDKNFRETERVCERQNKRQKRSDKDYHDNERIRERQHRKQKRIDENYIESEKVYERQRKRQKRSDKNYRDMEKVYERQNRKQKRTDKNYSDKEKNHERNSKKRKRENSEYRSEERLRESENRKKQRMCKDKRIKEAEIRSRCHTRKKQLSVAQLTERFHNTVRQGPCYICTSCKQLFYRHSVTIFCDAVVKSDTIKRQIPSVKSIDDKVWVCRTCKSHLSKGKVPPMSVMNKMVFPKQGILKELNTLEQNLLAVRIPFMKIHEATRGNQKFIHGNMVLVPADVDNTVTTLPRLTSNDSTIKATLKRRLRYKHHVYRINIRPQLVKNCANLLSTKPLYKQYVTVDNNWQHYSVSDTLSSDLNQDAPDTLNSDLNQDTPDTLNSDLNQDASDTLNSDLNQDTHETNENISQQSQNNIDIEQQNKSDDEWSEIDEEELVAGMSDTLLSAQDFIEPNERDKVYNFAPGEGSIPVSIFLENNVEELAFPGLFCGESRHTNEERAVNVTYGEIVKSELRSSDRRAALSIENIFFKTKKIQMKTLVDQAHLLLRKVQTKNQPLTVKDIRGESINTLLHSDKAYKALASIRGSPPYFEKVSKDLFAMIRQLGTATFFITLSAAETRWCHLLTILGKIVDDKAYTEEEIRNLTWEDKCRLIQSDPVTCARHFDYSVNKFLNEFLLTCAAPIGEIADYFYRVEYQNRGSPHIHMVVWCKDAPTFGTDASQDICDFVDKFISCNLPEQDDPLYDTVKLQVHRHSHTCRKKSKKVCRFGFPKPLFDRTVLLEPLSPQECTNDDINAHRNRWKSIHTALNEIDSSVPTTYIDFLSKLNLTEQDYISAIRSSIRTPTIFLKRTYAETRVNNYNPAIARAWRANTDIQFVLDVYACATYVASYLTKSQRGMSELLRKATNEAKQGDSDIRKQLKEVGNKFLNAVEISAQEAVYICLQLPMKRASRHVVFINTSPPEERVTLLKPKYLLDTMEEDDENIECSNLLSRYANRPHSMANITLAEFAAFYEETIERPMARNDRLVRNTVDKMLPETTTYENEDDDEENCPVTDAESNIVGEVEEHKTGSRKYRRRKRGHIIRSVHFNPDVDSEKYYRELIMLYYPWRDENELKSGCDTFCDRYNQIQQQIEECRKTYEPYAQQVELAQQTLSTDPDLQDNWDDLAPSTEDQNRQDKDRQQPAPDTGIEDYNMAGDLGLPIATSEDDLHEFHEMSDEDYRNHMSNLNEEQIKFVYDTMSVLKTASDPIFRFLSGGAGVGKSYVLQALYQTALKYMNKQAGENYATRRILLLAPTGKAAYHIKGSTIHNGLKIAANNKLQHRPLTSSQLNTLRNQIGSVKLLFIDEISMVGFRMLNCINQRLMEVMQSPKPFGGVSIIAVGDLYQLEPVYDSYLFQQPKSGFLPLATNYWVELFTMYELKEIMRQADSKRFAELLNRLREGQHTQEDLDILRSRILDRDSPVYPHNATHLMHKNADVNSFNAQVIQKSQKPVYTVTAKDRVVGSTPHHLREKILQSFKDSHEKTCQLSNVLSACEGINYDLTVNLNTSDGLTNGASCQIMNIDIDQTNTFAEGTLWVKFIDQSTGKQLRNESKRLYKRNIDKQWTPIQPVVKEFAAGKKGQAIIQRCQFPLRPSHAKSVHRSQGDTLDEAVIDLSTTRKINHIHYVAISRLKTLEGLHITNLQEDKISIDKHVVNEMIRLRSSPLVLTHKCLKDIEGFKLVFLNARSLNRHIGDVRKDENVLSSDVACFCETRFLPRDPLKDTSVSETILKFQYRQDSKQIAGRQRPPYGLVIYSTSIFSYGPYDESIADIDIAVFAVHQQPDITVILVYKSPKVPHKLLIQHLESLYKRHVKTTQCLILGDFNINWNEDTSNKQALQKLMDKLNLNQIIGNPTNDFGSKIDLIFTNIRTIQTGVSEAYYTDHKLCWVAL